MIEYFLSFADGRVVEFKVDPDRAPASGDSPDPHPFWSRLDYHQCPNCPLAPASGRCCPAMLDIEQIVNAVRDLLSYHDVKVEVRTADRSYVKQTDVQTALRSLLGLTLATGGCPILAQMKGPARLHLPFANVQETLVRMAGTYLLGQFLVAQRGGTPDWALQGLSHLYSDLQVVNNSLKRRLDAAAETDATSSAVIMLMGMAMLASFSLEQQLAELAPYAMGGTGSAK